MSSALLIGPIGLPVWEEEVDVEVEEVASAVEIEVDSMIEDLETEIEEEAAEEEVIS